jgi:membrane protein
VDRDALRPALILERGQRFFREELWAAASFPARALQLVVLVGQGFVRDRLTLRATALAYVTALALIPLLALAVALIGALGVSENVISMAVEQIAAGSPQAADWILRFVEGVDFGSLGSLGAATLFATTVLAIGNAERALNDIFGVRRQRTWMRRFADYLTVLIVAPLLVGVALSLRTTLETQWMVARLLEVPELARLWTFGLTRAPLILTIVAFSFLYWFLPNTEVRPLSALLGGVVAALLFGVAQNQYVGFNIGAARFGALFGTFAFLPLFLVWIYLSWVIVLLGGEVAFAHQHLARYRREVRAEACSAADRESAGLAIALAVGQAFSQGEARTAEDLAEELDVPVRLVRDLVENLERGGILAPRSADERAEEVQLGRPAEQVRVVDVQTALRGPQGMRFGEGATGRLAQDVMQAQERRLGEAEGAETLAQLLSNLSRHREAEVGHIPVS